MFYGGTKMLKRFISIGVLVLSLTILFVGCGKAEKNDKQYDSSYNLKESENQESNTTNNSDNNEVKKENDSDKLSIITENDKKVQEPVKEKLDNTERSWWYTPKKNGEIPLGPKEGMEYNKLYNGYYLGDTSKKYIYLTFDEGYENGYTPKILDVLYKENVKAAFFVTLPYIKEHPELVKRMIDEGHVVGNHSATHPSMAQKATQGREVFNKELLDVEKEFKKVTGRDIDKFFRPPMGIFSETSMSYTNLLGYKSIYWSFAYGDYDENKQPDPVEAKNLIIERTHNGGIYLLHAMSKTNTGILEELIEYWKSQGFEFRSLYEI